MKNEFARKKIVALIAGVVEGRIELTPGVQDLMELLKDFYGRASNVNEVFEKFYDETQAFPLGQYRKNWPPATVIEKDAERKVIEDRWRPEMLVILEKIRAGVVAA